MHLVVIDYVIIDGESLGIASTRALNHRNFRIGFGDLEYESAYVTIPGTLAEEKLYNRKQGYLKDHLQAHTPPMTLSATLGEFEYIFNGWVIRGMIGKGCSRTVPAALNSVGKTCAVKQRFRRNTGSAKYIYEKDQCSERAAATP